ncbi:MAG TPA: TetR/AcrR family transcriptional regulator [Streptosporangiaceae bacterium]
MEPDDADLWPLFQDLLRPPRGDRDGRPAPPGRATQDSRDKPHARGREQIQRMQDRGHQAPRRARSLSRQEIVAAAVKVADAEGAEAINMRRIARELNAGAMSLYWHVSSKEELLDLMLDAVEGEQEFPAPTGDWRADVEAVAVGMRAGLIRHEWVMGFIGGRPPLGPNTVRNLEDFLAIIDQFGVDAQTAMNVLGTVGTYVMGAVLREFRERNVERRDLQWQSGIGAEDGEKFVLEQLAKLKESGRFPNFIKMFEAGIDPDAAETRDERFMFGLQCVLDGVAARLTRS